jgi:flagellar biogenesis protein FliO
MLDGFSVFLTSCAALAGIVAAIVLMGKAIRRTPFVRSGAGERSLSIRDTIALGGGRRLYLVQQGDRAVLLLVGGASDIVVGWSDVAKPP